ncbi:MAG: ShlB/FhaC/HecB family hemolysin secretion/activation protein [Verrucomicrobiae bacterium]|nr:ShlB/FhaC/HecB family hemolysin secretion/activation protein [Verrucomicrobiae bacterium]
MKGLFPRVLPGGGAAAFAVLLLPLWEFGGAAWAQNLDPRDGDADSSSRRLPLSVIADDSRSTEPALGAEETMVEILPELKAIRLLADAGEAGDAAARARMERLISEKVEPALSSYVGKPLTIGALLEIKATAQRIFDHHSVALTRVLLPEQEVSSGEILLVAVTARVGEIESDRPVERNAIRLGKGDALDRQTLVDDLDWLNRASRRSATALLTTGDEPGETNIRLGIDEIEKPWRLLAAWDNHGVEILGEERWTFGASHLDLFGAGIEAGYEYVTDSEFDRLAAHIAHATIPLPAWRHEVRWLGYLADSSAPFDLGAGREDLTLGGRSWQSSLEYRVPLARAFRRRVRHEAIVGFDAKGANTDIEFGFSEPFRTNTEIYQFKLGYEAGWTDKRGRTRASAYFLASPGGWNGQNDDAAFAAARFEADSSYSFAVFGLERTIDLPGGFVFDAEFSGQVATSNLLPSEQLSLSGPWAVRGFAPSEIRADDGCLARLELLAPPLAVGGRGLGWQPFGFFDAGWGRSVDPLDDEETLVLASGGLGVRGEFRNNISSEIHYAWQITEDGFDDPEMGRFEARVILRW